jgi:hypothetical protein
MSIGGQVKGNALMQLPPEEDAKWAQVVGSLLLLFGTVEFISFRFIEMLNGDTARDSAMRLQFARRIETIIKLIGSSTWPETEKKEALNLWAEVKKESKMRNDIAHNPYVLGTDETGRVGAGILNIRHLRGTGPFHPPLIHLDDIALSHDRLVRLAHSLNSFVKPR